MTTGATTAIVYPETGGMPLPDGEYQAPLYRRIVRDLEVHFRDTCRSARVNGDTFIYHVEGNPQPVGVTGLLRGLRTIGRVSGVD